MKPKVHKHKIANVNNVCKLKHLLICLPTVLFAQQIDTTAVRFSKYVTTDGMKKNLTVLASDEYEGRETGEKGQKMSAAYISNYYKELGIPALKQLKDGYQQSYPLNVFKPQTVKISTPTKEYKQNVDFYTWANITGDTNISISEIIFCGYGIHTDTYNDYTNVDVKGKTIMILAREPKSFSKNGNPSEWTTNYRMKLQEAKKQGVKYIIVADGHLQESMREQEHRINSTRMSIDKVNPLSYPFIIYVSGKMAGDILLSKKESFDKLMNDTTNTTTFPSISVSTNLNIQLTQEKHSIQAENVMAYIEGSDLKDEVIVMSAHYDHLGVHNGKVFNGADDDGSGTVAVMQLAKAFEEAKKQGKGPRRSLLFLNVSGEEKGLLGSEYYSEFPVFNLKQTVCDLNIDMIGRLDDAHKNNPNYIYLIGSDKLSSELHKISEDANKTYTHLKLDYTYNDENDPNRFYYRSDHYNFAKNNVPVIFYFNGVHEDYHQETDEVQKIDFTKMEKITRLVFFTAWKLANQTERIKIDSNKK